MTEWEIAGQFFLGLIVTLFILWPYIRGFGTEIVDAAEDRHRSTTGHDSVRQVMADLEYDFATGKLSEEDYERLRNNILSESDDLELEQIERSAPAPGEEDDSLEKAIRQARETLE